MLFLTDPCPELVEKVFLHFKVIIFVELSMMLLVLLLDETIVTSVGLSWNWSGQGSAHNPNLQEKWKRINVVIWWQYFIKEDRFNILFNFDDTCTYFLSSVGPTVPENFRSRVLIARLISLDSWLFSISLLLSDCSVVNSRSARSSSWRVSRSSARNSYKIGKVF